MESRHERSGIGHALLWIVVYTAGSVVCNQLPNPNGEADLFRLVFRASLTIVLLDWIIGDGHKHEYGLCKPAYPPQRFFFYLPLIVFSTNVLWQGVSFNYKPLEYIAFALDMLCVGFLEEVMFRGLLYKALRRKSIAAAAIISSVAFGAAHLANLINGSSLTFTLCQVAYTTATGFMFVTLFERGGSLLPCIIAHALYNILSAFGNTHGMTEQMLITYTVTLCVIALTYTLILINTLPARPEEFPVDDTQPQLETGSSGDDDLR